MMKYLIILCCTLFLVSCGEEKLPSSKLLCDCANKSLGVLESNFLEKLTETSRTTGDFHDTILKITNNEPGIILLAVDKVLDEWDKGLQKIITDNNMSEEQLEEYIDASTEVCPDQLRIIYYFLH